MPLGPKYENSHALIIGVNQYKRVNPLAYACNDARAVAEVLQTRFGFPEANVRLLLDAEATRSNVLSSFLQFANDPGVTDDDRIVVFFAGHGHTVSGRRGETGFLVPVDGSPDDLATMIRWDELTRGADLIPAKHILFLMDACYGGLAFSRKPLPPGSMRFLKDMMMRYSRQVLTAGKADETVSDSGGTRKGHSIFTSNLLDALEGAAATQHGIISANGVMAYVYEKVGQDLNSKQTPHYGFVDGDGDLILTSHVLDDPAEPPDGNKEADVLVKLAPSTVPSPDGPQTFYDVMKSLLADPTQRIRLDDFIAAHTRSAIDRLSTEHFPVSYPYTEEEFVSRVTRYDAAIGELIDIVVLLSRWAGPEQLPQLERLFGRLVDAEKAEGGLRHWIDLQWYPILVLMYAAGISALSAGNYQALTIAITSPVRADSRRIKGAQIPLVFPVVEHLTKIVELFKKLPGQEKRYTPRSDHLLTLLQPKLEDTLFLGRSYEDFFDKFEVLLALTHAELYEPVRGDWWGPPGRFAWLHHGHSRAPFENVVSEAKKAGNTWGPLRAGLFQGTLDRFLEAAKGYRALMKQIAWH